MTKLPNWAKWVARDKDGLLWGFNTEPVKKDGCWINPGLGVRNDIIRETDGTYAHVKWGDDEPTPVKTISDENLLTEFHRLDKELTKEAVNHPTHYQGNKFEVIDIIEDYDLNFHLGNVVKYVLRADKKGNRVEDLRKAQFYINRELEREEE